MSERQTVLNYLFSEIQKEIAIKETEDTWQHKYNDSKIRRLRLQISELLLEIEKE